MPFALIIAGIVLLAAGYRDTQAQLFKLLKNDFVSTGQKGSSFLPWLVAILVVGAIGYVEELRPLSRAFLVLLIVVLFLSNGGFFSKFFGSVTGPSPVSVTSNTVSQPQTESILSNAAGNIGDLTAVFSQSQLTPGVF